MYISTVSISVGIQEYPHNKLLLQTGINKGQLSSEYLPNYPELYIAPFHVSNQIYSVAN